MVGKATTPEAKKIWQIVERASGGTPEPMKAEVNRAVERKVAEILRRNEVS